MTSLSICEIGNVHLVSMLFTLQILSVVACSASTCNYPSMSTEDTRLLSLQIRDRAHTTYPERGEGGLEKHYAGTQVGRGVQGLGT